MGQKTDTVTRPVEAPAAYGEGELLAAALTAALVEYKKYLRDAACAQAQEAAGTQWRNLGRWEQLAGARRA